MSSSIMNGMDLNENAVFFQIVQHEKSYDEKSNFFQKVSPPEKIVKGKNHISELFTTDKDALCNVRLEDQSKKIVSTSFPHGFNESFDYNSCMWNFLHNLKNTENAYFNTKFIVMLNDQKEIVAVMAKKLVYMAVKQDDMRFLAPKSIKADSRAIDNFINLYSLKDHSLLASIMKQIDAVHDTLCNDYLSKDPNAASVRKSLWNNFINNQLKLVNKEADEVEQILKQSILDVPVKKHDRRLPSVIVGGSIVLFIALFAFFYHNLYQ